LADGNGGNFPAMTPAAFGCTDGHVLMCRKYLGEDDSKGDLTFSQPVGTVNVNLHRIMAELAL
jgi:hypothetical protein